MSSLDVIKAAAAKLSARERNDLAVWLSESEDVLKIRREELRQEIELGLDQILRGEIVSLERGVLNRNTRERLARARTRLTG